MGQRRPIGRLRLATTPSQTAQASVEGLLQASVAWYVSERAGLVWIGA